MLNGYIITVLYFVVAFLASVGIIKLFDVNSMGTQAALYVVNAVITFLWAKAISVN
jgi:hypothetical protein